MSEFSEDGVTGDDQIYDEFEAAWKLEQEPLIEDYLARAKKGNRAHVFIRLVRLEFSLRERSGRLFDWDGLHQRFPDEAEALRQIRHELDLTVDGDRGDVETGILSVRDSNASGGIEAGVLGDYELLSQIGRGGMGIVYKARHVDLDRLFAVKVLPIYSSIDKSARARFQIEAKAAAQLDHPHIVPVYAFGIQEGTYYYAMQYVDGGNLAETIRGIRDYTSGGLEQSRPSMTWSTTSIDSEGRITTVDSVSSFDLIDAVASKRSTSSQGYLKAFARIGVQIADALHYAHNMGIVHRDIKPSNLLVDPHGDVYISDFGLARVQGESELTAPGNIVGTLRYMSPEQAYAQRIVVDHRTDIFSLGATLYELLLLRYAFDGRTKAEILKQIAFHEPLPPRRVDSRVPEDLETIVLKCLAKNPDERYQTAAEVSVDLNAWLNDEPIAARPPSFLQRGAKWARKHRSLVRSAVAISLVSACSIFSALAFAVQVETEAREEAESKNEALTTALNVSEGRRMTALASLELPRNPGLAASLATAGLRKNESSEGRTTLLAAQDANHERRIFKEDSEMGMALISPTGNSLLAVPKSTSYRSEAPRPALLYDASTGEQVRELPERQTITSAAFHSEGNLLATVTSHGDSVEAIAESTDSYPVSIWNLGRGVKLCELQDAMLLRAHSRVFCPVGETTLIAAPAKGNLVRVYNAAGDVHREFAGHTDHVSFAAFGPLGRKLVSIGQDRTVRVWDFDDGEELVKLDAWERRSQVPLKRIVQYAELSPDETELLTISTQVGVELWDLENSKSRSCGRGEFATFSPDGEQIAIVNYRKVRLLESKTLRPISELVSPDRDFHFLQFSSDSSRLVTCNGANMAQVWDSVSGELVCELRGHDGPVNHVAFSPDGMSLLSASDDGTLRQWDIESGADQLRFSKRLATREPIGAVAHGGEKVLMTTESAVTSAVRDHELERTLCTVPGRATEFDHSGRRFCTFEEHVVHVWESQTGDELASFQRRVDEFREARISPDGNSVVISSNHGPTWLWRWQEDKRVLLRPGPETTYAIDFHPSESRFATGGEDGFLRQWNSETGEMIHEHQFPIALLDLKYSRDGSRVVVVTRDQKAAVIDSVTNQEVVRISRDGVRFDLARFSASGKYIATFNIRGGSQYCWDAASGDLMHEIEGPKGVITMSISPKVDRALIVARDSSVLEWDLVEGTISTRLEGQFATAAYGENDESIFASSLRPMPDFNTGAEDRIENGSGSAWLSPRMHLFDATESAGTREAVIPNGVIGWIRTSLQGDRVLVRQRHYGFDIASVETKRTVNTVHAHGAPISFAKFTPDDERFVTCSWDGQAIVWNTETVEPVYRLAEHDGPILTAAMSSDGRLLAAALEGGSIVVWDISSGTKLRTLVGLESSVKGCSFGAFGSRLAAFARDGSWRVWDVATGEMVELPGPDQRMHFVGFQPNGSAMVLFPRPVRRAARDAQSDSSQGERQELRYPLRLRRRDGTEVELPHIHPPRVIRFSPSGNYVLTVAGRVATTGDELVVWNAATGKKQMTLTKPGSPLRFADMDRRDATIMTVHGESITAWSVNGKERISVTRELGFRPARNIDCFSPDGQTLFAVAQEGWLRTIPVDPLRDLRDSRPLTASERSRFHVENDGARMQDLE